MIVVRAPWSNSCYSKKLNRLSAISQSFIVRVGLAVLVGWWLSRFALADNPWPIDIRSFPPLQEPFLIQEPSIIYVLFIAYVVLLLQVCKPSAFRPVFLGAAFASLQQPAGSHRMTPEPPLLACSPSDEKPAPDPADDPEQGSTSLPAGAEDPGRNLETEPDPSSGRNRSPFT